MEATTATATEGKPTAEDRELALQLGALMLHVLGSEGGSVIRAIDDTGLNFVQMKALFALASADEGGEPLSVKSLAERLDVSLPSASRAVEDLNRRKLVTRTEDPEDRRVKRVSLTAAGRRISDTVLAARLRGLERFATGLSAVERRKLAAALDVLLERDEIAALHRTHSRRSSSR
ncbi:hypothetical protein BH20ACT15_BH20ACT15_01610 [soil metagenome]